MLDPGPFNAFVYWGHVVLGFSSVGFVLAALFATKGGRFHRWAGRLFSVSMGLAAVTAIIFSLTAFSPPAIISALSVIYGLAMAILSLRSRSGILRALQWGLLAIPLIAALLFTAGFLSAIFVPTVQAYLAFLLGPAAIFFALLSWSDFGFLRADKVSQTRRLKRHALRMGIAAAEVARAPLISFGPAIAGDFTFNLYFFGSFILVAGVYFLAMPEWVARTDEPAPHKTA